MKHFMQARGAILGESHSTGTDTPPMASSSSNSGSVKQRSASNRKQKVTTKENSDPNLLSDPSLAGKHSAGAKIKSPLPPRPPGSNPLKRKLNVECVPDNGVCRSSDSGVEVIVRMRPPNKDEEGEMIVKKISSDSLSILGHTFTFDSVADTEATQSDIFQLVGAPLVENCLAGFNSSVFAYGQTGSGKTYTMWGPANALLEENLSSDQQGLTPRVFERLFTRISEEQTKQADKQLMYQCRCSFLEIYNEQITDLLDATQKHLQIREDVKTGLYVENLTEEYVGTMKDVTQLLIKGFSNRRTGATSINAESSRSHSVFTCVVESRYKSKADGLSYFKTSRINLVDLAGSERQKLTGAAGERLKEAGNINRSLSQLGNLINILGEVSQTGKQRHIPYRDSKLTFLLQESLGGNAKLAMVCAISPAQSCKSETLSTLRFANRAKAIKNKAVVNEEMQDDVNVLREVIRQLKDELLQMKAKRNPTDPGGGSFSGWDARRSLSLLKFSLNRPMMLPRIDDDGDEEMEIVEDANHEVLPLALNQKTITMDENKLVMAKANSQILSSEEGKGEPHSEVKDTDLDMDDEIPDQVDRHEMLIDNCGDPSANPLCFSSSGVLNNCDTTAGNEEKNLIHSSVKILDKHLSRQPNEVFLSSSVNKLLNGEFPSNIVGDGSAGHAASDSAMEDGTNSLNVLDNSNLSIVPCNVSPDRKSPTPSVSPKVSNSSRKSVRTSSVVTASSSGSKGLRLSLSEPPKGSCLKDQSILRSKKSLVSTEHLAASLHCGLEILNSHRQSSAMARSSFRFYKPADIMPLLPTKKVDVGIQTQVQDNELKEEDKMVYMCSNCKNRNSQELKDAGDCSKLQLVPIDGSQSADKSKKLVPKAVEKVLAGAIRREMALEEFCAKQTSEIIHLNRLVQQYKHERECNVIIGQTREDKIARLESLMDGILSTKEFMEDELECLKNEHKLLKEKYDNHPEVLRTKIELRRVQDELEQYRNFYDLGERDVLLEEVQDLRSQLQYYVDSSPKSTRKHGPFLQLTYPCEPNAASPLCTVVESTEEETADQKLERERSLWTETESKWISIAEELRIELEASQSLVEKQKQELNMEKKCSEELKEALQIAIEGHARMLEHYAELEEKHIHLLNRQRNIQDCIDDVKKAATKAGVRGAETRFINALCAEIAALKAEREKERRYFRDENKGLQAQLRDTAEAVQAAGELLVRLKETEESLAGAEKRAAKAEQETMDAYNKIDKLKRKHESEISNMKQLHTESRLPQKEAPKPVYDDSEIPKYDATDVHTSSDQQWKEEFEPFYKEEEELLSRVAEQPSSWFSGYDRCNI